MSYFFSMSVYLWKPWKIALKNFWLPACLVNFNPMSFDITSYCNSESTWGLLDSQSMISFSWSIGNWLNSWILYIGFHLFLQTVYGELGTVFETVWGGFFRVIIRDQVDHHMFTFFGIVKLSSQRLYMQTKMCYD